MVIMDLNKEWSSEEFFENKKCCTDCKTTKTPLWRGGPAGPKTLCNACGIRYRKKRDTNPTVGVKQDRKRERAEKTVANGGDGDLKESLKMKLMALGDEVLLKRSSSSSASVIVKKQRRMKKLGEEEQAAVCLMALSCGFVFA